MSKLRKRFTLLPVIIRVFIYLGGNYLILMLVQFVPQNNSALGKASSNILFCALLLLFTKWILQLEGRRLNSIGAFPTRKRHFDDLFIGMTGGALMLFACALLIKLLTGFHWIQNSAFNYYALLSAFITVFASAYLQELAFRGYPFQLLVERYGIWPAQIIIAVLFGAMHLDASMTMKDVLLTMFSTGVGSIFFGMAFLKTNNLALPVGLHFGWNYLQLLLPRHPGQNGTGIWLIDIATVDPSKFSFLVWLLPYFAVMGVAFLALRVMKKPGT